MNDAKQRKQPHKKPQECEPRDLKEPKSPAAAIAADGLPAGGSLRPRAMPGESTLASREDMSPADHRPVEPTLPEGCELPEKSHEKR